MKINKDLSVNKRIFTWWERLLLIIASVITTAVLTYSIIRIIEFWPLDHYDLGTVGQFFGGLFTPIVASIGVVYLYGTYRIQFCSIETQVQLADKQQTEQAFFALLKQQQVLADSLTNDFTKVKRKLQKSFRNKATLCHKDVNKAFNTAFSKDASKFEQYYRHLTVLLECATNIKEKDRKSLYSNIIQARMSADELYVACVYGISDYGCSTLHPFMHGLGMLNSLQTSNDETVRSLVSLFHSIQDKAEA